MNYFETLMYENETPQARVFYLNGYRDALSSDPVIAKKEVAYYIENAKNEYVSMIETYYGIPERWIYNPTSNTFEVYKIK